MSHLLAEMQRIRTAVRNISDGIVYKLTERTRDIQDRLIGLSSRVDKESQEIRNRLDQLEAWQNIFHATLINNMPPGVSPTPYTGGTEDTHESAVIEYYTTTDAESDPESCASDDISRIWDRWSDHPGIQEVLFEYSGTDADTAAVINQWIERLLEENEQLRRSYYGTTET